MGLNIENRRYIGNKSKLLKFIDDTIKKEKIRSLIGGIFNYLSILVCNITDCLMWFISWIPGLNNIIYMVYTCPDLDLKLGIGHRNFITHSVLNPIFIGFVVISILLIVITSFSEGLNSGIRLLLFLIGMTFTCHLLADTMPNKWMGTAYIKFLGFSLKPPFLSVIWLYANSFISFCINTMLLTVGEKSSSS